MGLGGAGSLDLLDRASDVPGLVGFEFRRGESGGGGRGFKPTRVCYVQRRYGRFKCKLIFDHKS